MFLTFTQWIILILFFIIIIIPVIYKLIELERMGKSGEILIIPIVMMIFFFIMFGLMVADNNKDNRCPEYEKIENVYIIKEK